MDIITTFNFFIIALVAVSFPIMTLSGAQAKRYLLITTVLFMAPLAIVLIGKLLGWFAVYYVDVILLQRGILSISFAVGYGIIAGLLLNGFKVALFSLFSRARNAETSHEKQEG